MSKQYPTFREARRDYPYCAHLTEKGRAYFRNRAIPAFSVWHAFARQLDSGEIELLLDGTGSTARYPGSTFNLHAPPEDEEQDRTHNPASATAWDQALTNT